MLLIAHTPLLPNCVQFKHCTLLHERLRKMAGIAKYCQTQVQIPINSSKTAKKKRSRGEPTGSQVAPFFVQFDFFVFGKGKAAGVSNGGRKTGGEVDLGRGSRGAVAKVRFFAPSATQNPSKNRTSRHHLERGWVLGWPKLRASYFT